MKRVLLCERSLSGHRKVYLNKLSEIRGCEFFSYAPGVTDVPKKNMYISEDKGNDKSLTSYLSWISGLRKIVKKEKIDIVHILDGDSIMRFFGLGFWDLKCIITYHHFYDGQLRKISYRMLNHNKKSISVVHTEPFKERLIDYGIKNTVVCDYPAFNFEKIDFLNTEECKTFFGLRSDAPVIGMIGNISAYKRIVPFLKIMQNCNTPFQILLCGKPNDVSEEEINMAIEPYKKNVIGIYRLLNDEEYYKAIKASDIIYSIYGLEFDGASGPLTDGVCGKKMVLSSSHGSLGNTMRKNDLGIIVNVEDDKDVLNKTEYALTHVKFFQYDEKADAYRERIKPIHFLERYRDIYMED